MSPRRRTADDELPMSPPVLYVLLAVTDRKRHGYAIMQEVERRTDGKVRLLPGSLYSTIRRMLETGLIEEARAAKGDDARRRYYRISAAGRAAARTELERLEALMHYARQEKLWPTEATEN